MTKPEIICHDLQENGAIAPIDELAFCLDHIPARSKPSHSNAGSLIDWKSFSWSNDTPTQAHLLLICFSFPSPSQLF